MDWNTILTNETDFYNRYDFRAEMWESRDDNDDNTDSAPAATTTTEFETEMPF